MRTLFLFGITTLHRPAPRAQSARDPVRIRRVNNI